MVSKTNVKNVSKPNLQLQSEVGFGFRIFRKGLPVCTRFRSFLFSLAISEYIFTCHHGVSIEDTIPETPLRT